MLSELDQLDVKCCSLLVIPNHHGRGHFLDDRKFCEWLRAQEDADAELVEAVEELILLHEWGGYHAADVLQTAEDRKVTMRTAAMTHANSRMT